MSSQKVTKGKQGVVLVVDDDFQMLTLMGDVLEQEGLIVLTAESPRRAVALLHKYDVSLVLLDWVFNQSSAEETFGRDQPIRTGEAFLLECQKKDPWLPVIVMSGFRKVDVSSQALLKGAVSFLRKPFATEVLVKHITFTIQRSIAARNRFSVSSADEIITLDEVAYRYVRSVIDVLGGNASEAAKRLDLHRQTIKKILESGGLEFTEQESEN
jgi:two-component system response regulator RegA